MACIRAQAPRTPYRDRDIRAESETRFIFVHIENDGDDVDDNLQYICVLLPVNSSLGSIDRRLLEAFSRPWIRNGNSLDSRNQMCMPLRTLPRRVGTQRMGFESRHLILDKDLV